MNKVKNSKQVSLLG